jgi:hypothetical protein
MRSGWPTEGGWGSQPANSGREPFGPEDSWSSAQPNLEYANGGYDQSGYQGQGYSSGGYARPMYQPQEQGYAGSGYSGGEIELAYPRYGNGATDLHQQPWDYEQPLRYDAEEVPFRDQQRGSGAWDVQGYGSSSQGTPSSSSYDGSYNGSEYSVPGVGGPGYDLSGIISTNEFDSVGYDMPRHGRLSYDDPRYPDAPRNPVPPVSGPQPVQRNDETRYDLQRYDESKLDSLWQAGDDVRRENGTSGYDRPAGQGPSSGGYPSTGSQLSGGYPSAGGRHSSGGYPSAGYGTSGGSRARAPMTPAALPPAAPAASPRAAQTRYDMRALADAGTNTRFDMKALPAAGNHTRFDVPKYDESRLDNMRASGAAPRLRVSGGIATAPGRRPRAWADDTSLDKLGNFDLRDQPLPSTYARPDSRPMELPHGQDDRADAKRGKRRGRRDGRQWMALGAIAIVAAGAIGGVLVKHVFSGASGPAHTVAAPHSLDGFTRATSLEQQNHVSTLAESFAKSSGGQASDLQSAVYQQGNLNPTAAGAAGSAAVASAGANAQLFIFVGGKLAGADVAGNMTNFEQAHTGTQLVSSGTTGGEEACGTDPGNGQSMCVWFDNDTFGVLMSPSMNTAKLAATMNTVRPGLELNG